MKLQKLLAALGVVSLLASTELTYAQNCTPNAYEPNENVSTAAWFPKNSAIVTTLSNSSDVDFYNIYSTAAGTLSLHLTVPGINYNLQLIDKSTNAVLAQSLLPGGLSDSITYKVTANKNYVVKVFGVNGAFNAASCYLLKNTLTTTPIQNPCVSSYENNDDVPRATPFALNSTINSGIINSRDWDFFKIIVPSNGDLTINLTNLPVDLDMVVYPTTNVAGKASTNSGLTNETIVLNVLAGTYYIRVNSKDSIAFSLTKCYTLTNSFKASAPSCYNSMENNGSIARATPIALNTTISTGITSAKDLDYFKVVIGGPGVLNIDLTNLPDDLDLVLYDSSNNVLQTAKLYNLANENIKYAVNAGNYFIRVNRKGGVYYGGAKCYTLSTRFTAGARLRMSEEESLSESEVSDLAVFPNPVISGETITLKNIKNATEIVRILDSKGMIVAEKIVSENNPTLILDDIKPGIYTLQSANGAQKLMVK